MFILNSGYKEFAFYIYTNFDPVLEEIVRRNVLFLPGITISSNIENLKHNLQIIAATLQNSARRTFDNEKIYFSYSIIEMEGAKESSILERMMQDNIFDDNDKGEMH